MMTFDTAVAQILGARNAVELFGIKDQLQEYRRLAKLVHPDRVPLVHTLKATAAFSRLSELWANIKTITVKNYQVQGHIGNDGLADWFNATDDMPGHRFFLKINNRPANNDLMRREADNLKKIYDGLDSRHSAFFPALVETFPYRDETTDADRIVNVFVNDEDWFSLKTIMDAFPEGLDGRHVAWIWRRVLLVLGATHMEGVIHGAVLPENVLINPKLHAVRLVNWCFSASGSQLVPVVVSKYRDWYHDDVKAKKPPTPRTDIYAATQTILNLFEAVTRIPGPFYSFIKQCTSRFDVRYVKSSHQPLAFILLDELNKILENVYGPRKFTVFPDVPDTALLWPRQ